MPPPLRLRILKGEYSVCRVPDFRGVTAPSGVVFAAKTDDECSLVVESAFVPENVMLREDGWKVLGFEAVLDFSLIGILADVSGVLAKNQVSIFAVSTYNTDYILVKTVSLPTAARVLQEAGYEVVTATGEAFRCGADGSWQCV